VPATANGAPEVELKPYDNVLILQQPNWELQRVVTISGEVRFPGQYALKTRTDRLADLIARAGGFTTEAYPAGTVFTRRRDNVGRVAIDVPLAMKKRKSPDNLLLVDGDVIVVPQRSSVVTVRGAVNAANVVAYVPGKDIDYYIGQAGGPSRNADKRHAFVTQPTGKRETRTWFARPEPLPGSLVVVPELDPQYKTNWVQAISAATSLLTSLVTLYLLVNK
jgi:protein involved in polysaccharide export with SLBB domain